MKYDTGEKFTTIEIRAKTTVTGGNSSREENGSVAISTHPTG